MTKVLFVCLGNICRSPMAQGIFEALLKEHPQPNVSCDSAGTASYHIGKAPDSRTIEVLEKHNISTSQKARQLIPNDFESFDYILVMDKENLSDAHALSKSIKQPKAKVQLVLDYGNTAVEEVPDPYYGQKDGFEYVYTLLDEALRNFLAQITR